VGALRATAAKDESNDSRHGNALRTRFDGRFDINPAECSHERNHGYSRRKRLSFSDNQVALAGYRLADSASWFSLDR
jgi:hypothetical protein